jgi:hypothetical protein
VQAHGFYLSFADGDAFTFIVIALATAISASRVSPACRVRAGAFGQRAMLEAFMPRSRRIRPSSFGPLGLLGTDAPADQTVPARPAPESA